MTIHRHIRSWKISAVGGPSQVLEAVVPELIKTEAGRVRAMSIYRKARPGYHPIAITTLDEILGWNQNG
jgi:hypothetical protein